MKAPSKLVLVDKHLFQLSEPQNRPDVPHFVDELATGDVPRYSSQEIGLDVLTSLLCATIASNKIPGQYSSPAMPGEQDVAVYALMGDAVYLFDPAALTLRLDEYFDLTDVSEDLKNAGAAPLALILTSKCLVAALGRSDSAALDAGIRTGLMCQRVHDVCAQGGLTDSIRRRIDEKPVVCRVGLRTSLRYQSRVTVIQAIGYPKLM